MLVEYEPRGRVVVITINRPQRRNAIDRATASALAEAWRRFDEDDGADVAVLHGAQGHFSAGADLKAFNLVDTPGGFLGFTRTTVNKPTLAAIEGACVSGGLEMALWCDLRVAGRSAFFGMLNRRFDVPLVDGGTQRLPRVIGRGHALELILTGRRVEAEEALKLGLVNELVEPGEALSRALELARLIASYPQGSLRADRLAVLEGTGRPMGEGLAIERRHGKRTLDGAREGARRFADGAGRGGAPVTEETPVGVSTPEAETHVVPPVHAEPGPQAPEVVVEVERADSSSPADGWLLPPGGSGPPLLVLGLGKETRKALSEQLATLAKDGFTLRASSLTFDQPPGEGGEARSPDTGALTRALSSEVESLLGDERVVGERLAVVGFEAGGGLALWLATIEPRVTACVVFDPLLGQLHPVFQRTSAAFLGHHAEETDGESSRQAYTREMHLRGLGLDATFHTYRATRTGFWDPARSGVYQQAAAELAWERTFLFLGRAFA